MVSVSFPASLASLSTRRISFNARVMSVPSIAAAGQCFALFGFSVDKSEAVDAAFDGLRLLLWHGWCGGAHGVGSRKEKTRNAGSG